MRTLIQFTVTLLCVLGGIVDICAEVANLKNCESAFEKGNFRKCEELAREAMEVVQGQIPEHHYFLIKALRATGRYDQARNAAAAMLQTFPRDIQGLALSQDLHQRLGEFDRASEISEAIDEIAAELLKKKHRFAPDEVIALGEVALTMGADPKKVLAEFFQPMRKKHPDHLGAHLAAADLAIEKRDFALAAKMLGEARKELGDRVEILFCQARTFAPSDRKKANELLDQVLKSCPQHVPAIQMRAGFLMDHDKLAEARKWLLKAQGVDAMNPEAWALQAALEVLEGNPEAAMKARARGLEAYAGNPQVDYLIGKKIAGKRLFNEALSYQKQALEKDPDFLPAVAEVGQNLLRMGDEEEGWKWIERVHQADKYHVEAFNLMTLHDRLKTFTTRTTEHFIIRMHPKESDIYGDGVEELLEKAWDTLCVRYAFEPDRKVVVEFFPQQQDFAIRTIGIPGGLGILGACFGNVITMNSPGSAGAMNTNWKSTVWHEFCHTVTLGATANRIPRWFTEGFSVYEEGQRDPGCRRKMKPGFQQRILASDEEGLIPIEELSEALTDFSNGDRIMFAYFEAGLLVEYLIERFGHSKMNLVLGEIAKEMKTEDAIAKHLDSLGNLWGPFVKKIQDDARGLAEGVDWEKPDPTEVKLNTLSAVDAFLIDHPANIYGRYRRGELLLKEKRWDEAGQCGREIIDLSPQNTSETNGYAILVAAQKGLGDEAGERETLLEWAGRSPNAVAANMRLLEIDLAREDWDNVLIHAERQLAVNPLLKLPHQAVGVASQALGMNVEAVRAFERLLYLDPPNLADIQFRLAQLKRSEDPEAARMHVLRALEEAPRFRAAHRLLLGLKGESE